ncbi:MAG: hypothetical protein AAB268_00600 [Elusimicrobiota bacterium]
MSRLNADLRITLVLIAALVTAACRGGSFQPLGMSLQGFEKILPDPCKLDSTRKISDGVFKDYTLQAYNCGDAGRQELVIDGSRVLKYAILMDAAIFKDPRVIAAQRDQVLRLGMFGSLYTVAKNVPKGKLLDLLKQKPPEVFDIFGENWEKCIRLNVPMTSTLEGYAYSCEVENGDTVRFSVTSEGAYLKEKSLRIHGDPAGGASTGDSSGPDVLPKITGPRDCSRIDVGMSMNEVERVMGQKSDEPADIVLMWRDPNGPMGMGMPIRGFGLERKEFVGNLEKGFTYWYVSLSCTVEFSPRTARVSSVNRHSVVPLTAKPKGSEFGVYMLGRVPGLRTPEWASGQGGDAP